MTWAERVEGCRIDASVVKMSDRKNRDRDRASALSGHHLVKRRNNQLIVDASSGGCIKEETPPGRNVQGDAMPSLWLSNKLTKIDERKKYVVNLGGQKVNNRTQHGHNKGGKGDEEI